MDQVSMIGLDLAKHVFQIHGVSGSEQIVLRRQLRRGEMLRFFKKQAPCVVAMEACGMAHFWGRELAALGHEVRLLPPSYVRPYVKRGKNDASDAAAICEAALRPSMRLVPVKTPAQQAVAARHRVRDLMVRQRTMQMNAFRAHLAEFGVIAARGRKGLAELLSVLEAAAPDMLPEALRDTLRELAAAIHALDLRIGRLEQAIVDANRENATARQLLTIPGVGPITASAFSALVSAPERFACGRDLSAWIGLTPQSHSTGGKQRLGRISKQGDRYLRRLLVLGATSLLRRPDSAGPALAAWIRRMLANKPARLVTVALANKLARIVWAVLVHGGSFVRKTAAAI